jgi:hypothetical protein
VSFSLGTAEQAVAALMNMLRPVSSGQLRGMFCSLNGTELITPNVFISIPAGTTSNIKLFAAYTLRSLAADVSCHQSFRVGQTMNHIKVSWQSCAAFLPL